MKKIFLLLLSISFFIISCKKSSSNKSAVLEPELEQVKSHVWYSFTDTGFKKIDLPQNADAVLERPWTEAVRISSAGCVPGGSSGFSAFAVVNKKGLLAFGDDSMELFCDSSLFDIESADGLVFSSGMPVFYLFRSTFFNENIDERKSIHRDRPFLVEFNPQAGIFYPLVSYENIKLDKEDQITGFSWNGSKWACAAKKTVPGGVEFSYFYWQPLVELADLNPALGEETFLFNSMGEDEYQKVNMPKYWDQAPDELKKLLSSIPGEFSFYVSWRDNSGTSPVSYCQMGSCDAMLNAHGGISAGRGYSTVVFSDGTTYVKRISEDKVCCAFRLPRLPSGFSYGEQVVAGDTLYVAWEESSFYKTSRAGFISVDLKNLVKN